MTLSLMSNFSILVLKLNDKQKAYQETQKIVNQFLISQKNMEYEIDKFSSILKGNVKDLGEDLIRGSGYVLDSLEASIWYILNMNNYKDAVLKAVNLGDDTDTTDAITGAVAGLVYGLKEVPKSWLDCLVKKDDIFDLGKRLGNSEY